MEIKTPKEEFGKKFYYFRFKKKCAIMLLRNMKHIFRKENI